MSAAERALAGALSGFLAAFVLSGLRLSLNGLGLIYTTAPEQVVRRLEELGPVKDWSSRAQQALMTAAHFAYGAGAGETFGLLRAERAESENEAIEELRGNREGPVSEAAVGAGWAGWLPIVEVHSAPWVQKTPRALLPIVDHAALGAEWGAAYWMLSGGRA